MNGTALKFSFQLLAGKKEVHLVCSTTQQEKQDWITALNKAILEADKRKGTHTQHFRKFNEISHDDSVFGIPLSLMMKNPDQGGRSIPNFVEQCLDYVKQYG